LCPIDLINQNHIQKPFSATIITGTAVKPVLRVLNKAGFYMIIVKIVKPLVD